MATTKYTVEYEIRDLSVPRLMRRQLLTGRTRSGAEEVVTFTTVAAAEYAASIKRTEKGVLRTCVMEMRS